MKQELVNIEMQLHLESFKSYFEARVIDENGIFNAAETHIVVDVIYSRTKSMKGDTSMNLKDVVTSAGGMQMMVLFGGVSNARFKTSSL